MLKGISNNSVDLVIMSPHIFNKETMAIGTIKRILLCKLKLWSKKFVN